jgi:leucyl aminopeptidase
MGNDKELIQAVIKAGREEGEEYWELPLIEEYKEMLKSDVADISNVGGVNAGVITAALFLREFLPEKASWAHLDIAGPFLQEKPWKHYSAGATGFGLKTLVNLIYNIKDYELDKGMR